MRRYNVALYLSAFLLMFGIGMIMAILPQKMIHLSKDASHVGYLASAFALTFILIQIPIGRMSDKFGVKPFLIAGYLTCAVSGLFYYFSDNEVLILLGRMLQGLGEVPVWAMGPAILARQHPRQKGRVMGIYNAAVHCGLTTGSFIGIWTQDIIRGNQVFLMFAITGVLAGLITALFVKAPKASATTSAQPRRQETGSSLRFLVRRSGTVAVFGCILLYGAGYAIFITMVPGFLICTRGSGHHAVSFLFILFYITVSLSQVVAGPISDNRGQKPVMITGLGAAALGMVLFPPAPLAWMFTLLALAAMGLGTFCVATLSWLNQGISNDMKGTISGCFYFFWGMGYFGGPLLMGLFGAPDRWQNGFFLLGGLLATGMVTCTSLPKPVLRNHGLNV